MARNSGCCRRAKSALTRDCSPVRLPNCVEGYLLGQRDLSQMAPSQAPQIPHWLGSGMLVTGCTVGACEKRQDQPQDDWVQAPELQTMKKASPTSPIPHTQMCPQPGGVGLREWKAWCQQSLQLGKRSRKAGWRLSLALLYPPPRTLRNNRNSASPLLPDSLTPCQGSHNFLQARGGGRQGGGQTDLE